MSRTCRWWIITCTAAGWRLRDRSRFENGLNEANIEPLAGFDSAFDTQLGFAVRAHCSPLLGLPSHADADAYWDRRCEHTESDLARLFLTDANVSDWLVDTGFASGVADLAALADLSVGSVHEIVRLESVAEEAIKASGDYATAFSQLLARAGQDRDCHQVDTGLPRRLRRRADRAGIQPRWPRRRSGGGTVPAPA